jgi:hypothetical protein
VLRVFTLYEARGLFDKLSHSLVGKT